MPNPPQRLISKLLRGLLLAAGLVVFGWFVHRAGPAEIWRTVSRLGWMAPLVLVPFAFVYAAESLGWRWAFGAHRAPKLPFRSLYRIRWCGEAVNNVVPSGTVGGEAVKVYLLHKRGVPPGDATASVIVGRTVQTLMQVTFIAMGAAAFLHVAPDRAGLKPTLVVILVLCVGLIGGMFWLQARGLFTTVLTWTRALGLRVQALESRGERLLRIDRQVLDFYRGERRHFALSAMAYLTGWLLDTTDLLLVAWLLGMPIDWLHALAIEAFIGVARLMAFVVPGGIGIQETGISLIAQLAGLPDALGLAYAIIRRGRDVTYAGLGWGMLWLEEAGLRRLRERVEREAEEFGAPAAEPVEPAQPPCEGPRS